MDSTLGSERPHQPGSVAGPHPLLDRLIERAKVRPALTCAVIWPDEDTALAAAVHAHREGLIAGHLIGPLTRLRKRAAALELDCSGLTWIDAESPALALAKSIALARSGTVASLMKGHLHTDLLLAAILDREHGLRVPDRRVSHVYVIEPPGLGRLLWVSDAAVHIAPDLAAKRAITLNAITLARACGLNAPRVAILAAIETVNPAMPATVDAVALAQMSREGQMPEGALIDGPLAMDNAVNVQAAQMKGIVSPVAGQADVLIVPNIEAGNLLAKALTFLAHAAAAGVLVGARVPVILTSRADDSFTRRASCALARLLFDAASDRCAVDAQERAAVGHLTAPGALAMVREVPNDRAGVLPMPPSHPTFEQVDDELELVSRVLPVTEPCRLIELGCGAAALARALLARHGACTVTGLEVDRVQMAKNLAKPVERLAFVEAGAQSIPFAEGQFDAALMLKSLHHVPLPLMGQALREVARVLRPAGRLYVSEPIYGGAFNDIVRLYNDEGMVRAAAQGALDAALMERPNLWQQVDEIRFTMPVRYSGFDEFERKHMRPSYADHALDDALIARVRAAFEPHVGADGAWFDRLHHVRVFARTDAPAPCAAQ